MNKPTKNMIRKYYNHVKDEKMNPEIKKNCKDLFYTIITVLLFEKKINVKNFERLSKLI